MTKSVRNLGIALVLIFAAISFACDFFGRADAQWYNPPKKAGVEFWTPVAERQGVKPLLDENGYQMLDRFGSPLVQPDDSYTGEQVKWVARAEKTGVSYVVAQSTNLQFSSHMDLQSMGTEVRWGYPGIVFPEKLTVTSSAVFAPHTLLFQWESENWNDARSSLVIRKGDRVGNNMRDMLVVHFIVKDGVYKFRETFRASGVRLTVVGNSVKDSFQLNPDSTYEGLIVPSGIASVTTGGELAKLAIELDPGFDWATYQVAVETDRMVAPKLLGVVAKRK